jgi:hypothetical protein
MKCLGCASGSEGYAVIPGVGEAGEIRFYCDGCARRDRVKMRYWDGRDLDVGGWREKPDLGASFSTLVFGFDDVGRMRDEDLAPVLGWIEDAELSAALSGAPDALVEKVYGLLPLDRIGRVRAAIEDRETSATAAARQLFVSVVKRL